MKTITRGAPPGAEYIDIRSRLGRTSGAVTTDTQGSVEISSDTIDVNAVSPIPKVEANDPSDAPPQNWSARTAFLIGWLLPSTTAQRTQELPLRRAWLAHFVAALIAPVVISFCILLAELGSITEVAIATDIQNQLSQLAEDFQRHPFATILNILGIIAAVELGHAAFALLLMAWGARDEPLRDSFRNAIRQVWLRGAHVIPAAIVISSIAIPLSRMDTAWNAGYGIPRPEWPTIPQNTQPDPKAMADYALALQEFWAADRAWQDDRDRLKPWYLVFSPGLIGVTVCSTILWFLWALLRGIGAPRRAPPIARPPTCESCGYNLTTIAAEGRCPECAELVLSSIGPDARPGTIWQRRRAVGRFAAWWRCAVDSIVRPGELGRQCRMANAGTDHRWFFVLPLPAVTAMGIAAFWCIVLIYEDSNATFPPRAIIAVVSLLMGYLCGLGMLGFTLLTATAIGLFHSIREKRNLLPGSAQVAGYLAGYLTLWAAFGAATMVAVAAIDHAQIFAGIQERWGFRRDLAAKLGWFVPNAACGVWYLVLLSRGTIATRYANK